VEALKASVFAVSVLPPDPVTADLLVKPVRRRRRRKVVRPEPVTDGETPTP
jgi:hypothetical protein